MLILGIETTCDETAAAVVCDGWQIRSSIVSSSLPLHSRYGGIIPEIASRAHVESISFVVDEAVRKARTKLTEVSAIAVTDRPGLPGSLLVGVSFARALSFALHKPLIEVDHVQAHLYASFLRKKQPPFPFIGLVVSGGHTELFLVKDFTHVRMLGSTLDDAAGEAFDKVAKIINLGYPGGPEIERVSRQATDKTLRFGCATMPGSFDFSFSGIKTAVLYFTKDKNKKHAVAVSDIAYSFQKTVVGVLVAKAAAACRSKKIRALVLGGGVVANSYLRSAMLAEAKRFGIEVFFPDKELCIDNAAMVAGLGFRLLSAKRRSGCP